MALYDSFSKTFAHSRKSMQWAELDAIIDDILAQKYRSILDIGCGSGRFLEFFTTKCPTPRKYLGIDQSASMIAEAQKVHPHADFLVSDMTTLSGVTRQFDAIVLIASFHHLKTPSERHAALNHIKAHLLPHGRVYMTNWNLLEQERYQPYRDEKNDFCIKIWEFSRYYHGFSVDELESLFHEHNFHIEAHGIFPWKRNILSILTHKYSP